MTGDRRSPEASGHGAGGDDGASPALPRVLSSPPRHDYVDRLHGTAGHLVHRDEPGPRLERFHDPGWVRASAGDWDVAHLHFGWEQHGPRRLAAVLDAHHAGGTPVVWTAHDLRNPHTTSPTDDEVHLDALAARADRVVTLTAGAAERVHDRYGRRATVVPHGPLLTEDEMTRWRTVPRADRCTVLLHAKSCRRNVDLRSAVAAARDVADTGVAVDLVVALHEDVARRPELAELAGPGVRVVPHAPWSSTELCQQLRRAHALLLPYRWGTHSGLLELATDLGTPVIATDIGYLRDQQPLVPVAVREGELSVGDLRDAYVRVADGDVPAPVPVTARTHDLATFTAAHRDLYAELSA